VDVKTKQMSYSELFDLDFRWEVSTPFFKLKFGTVNRRNSFYFW